MARLQARVQQFPNVETAVCDLTNPADFEFVREGLDSVVCLNVLEHTQDDLTGFRNLYRCLKGGGRAVVLVPQGAGVYGSLDKVLGHFRRYSKSELEDKMRSAGFRIERTIEFNRVTYPGWYVNGRLLKREHFSRIQLAIFDRMVWIWRRIDPLLPWPPTSLICVGVRD
jgi:SAM-dependent methyltransferase